MSKVQYYCAATLDGYIADSNDEIDWLTGYEGSYEASEADTTPMGEGGSYDPFYEQVGALVSGSVTYEFVLEHFKSDSWPYAGKPYWVLSSRDLPTPGAEGADVRIVRGSVRDHFEEMMRSAGDRNLWVVGGGNVASQFTDEGLLEELHLTVVPVVLGKGKPLFDKGLPDALQLTGARTFANGMAELRYQLTDR
jgi:dihydrofolate reductase